MSIAPPFQTPPFPGFMPSMPNFPDEIIKNIKEHVDKRLDEVMEGKDTKYKDKFKHYVMSMMPKDGHHDSEKKKCSELECLYMKLYDLQKKAHEGKSLIEIEHEFHDKIKDLSHEEKRIFSSLLRSDGPLSLSFMLGIQYEDFINHMKCLGKKIHEHCCESHKKE
jgi:hypothetical protein